VDLDEVQHRYFRHQHQQTYNKPVINSYHFQNFWLIDLICSMLSSKAGTRGCWMKLVRVS
jgi:hypothetical protein